MLQPLQLQQVSSHYPQAIAELQDFLAKTGLRLDAPETLGDMAARLQSDRAFRRDLISHVWMVLHLSGRQMTYSDLLGVLALAAAGPQLAAAADQAEAHELLRFLMEARGSFEATPASMAVVAPGTVVESRMEPPARPPLRPLAFPATAFARTRWHLQKRDSEPEPTGQRRLVWVAAACLLLAGCLGLWWHHRPAADRSAAPALPAHAAPVTAAENPPTEVADLHATSHGSEAAAGGAPSARKNSPNRPAKPSPLVLRTAPPAAAAVRPITPVHLGTSVAPPSAATGSAATPSSQPNPLPRRRVATPAQPKAAPNPLADSAPAEATAANGGNGTANAPHGGYVRPTSLGTMAANVMYSPAPAYPAAASAAHVQGEVRLEAEVDPDGNVASTRVISGPPLLRDAAADAVQHWRYRPYLYDGKPVAMNALVVMDFHLP